MLVTELLEEHGELTGNDTPRRSPQDPGDHRGGEELRDPSQAEEANGDKQRTDQQGPRLTSGARPPGRRRTYWGAWPPVISTKS
jgi:hypothetical protein